MENKYSISIFWSEQDDSFIALSPDFPGFSAFGDTREKAVSEAGAALAAMLTSLRDDRADAPEPRLLPRHSGQLRIRIPKTLHTRLALEAERQGVSLNTLIVGLLERGQAQSEALRPLLEEMAQIKNALQATRAEFSALKDSRKQVEDMVSLALHAVSTRVYTPLEVQASYRANVNQPEPRVYFRSEPWISN